ncbi:MAG: DegT/DnrJ/EryC1/StrS family aminotransferase [Parachlamydiaceae bacterium]|nr:DegT/DnrJ/EryC1/StrS family aminotransferase [Parachlamydiaceae bacterium]
MKVPFLDLSVPSEERAYIHQAIDKVLEHGKYALGPEVVELENTFARHCGKKFAVGVNSGTDALFLSLKALEIGTGDEVITTSLSWIATAGAISLTGATPVFADIKEDLNIDPISVEALITSKTKAILPVHFTGKICDMQALMRLAKKHQLAIVEDGAQAFGATFEGRSAGSFGMFGCFSMNPWKIYGGYGEAGMIVTDEEDYYQKLLALRCNGIVNKETCIANGVNSRLDTIQAAILLQKFKGIDAKIAKRREMATYYHQKLSPYVHVPLENPNQKDIYYTYQIQTSKRDALKAFLENKGIETKIQHPILMCRQPIYDSFRSSSSNAEKIVEKILCLPIQERLSKEQQDHVVESIALFFNDYAISNNKDSHRFSNDTCLLNNYK